MYSINMQDFNKYALIFKENHKKGVIALKNILANPDLAVELINNYYALAVIYGTEDKNSKELQKALNDTEYALEAMNNYCASLGLEVGATWEETCNNIGMMEAIANSEEAMKAMSNSSLIKTMNIVASAEAAREAIASSSVARNIVGTSSMAVSKVSVGIAGLDPTEYADMEEVVNSDEAMTAIATSSTAMNVIANSDIAMDKIMNSETAKVIIGKSSIAVAKMIAGLINLDPADYTDMNALIGSETIISAIINSDSAMNIAGCNSAASGKLVASSASLDPTKYADMEEVVNSDEAMTAIASSSTAMQKVASLASALNVITKAPTEKRIIYQNSTYIHSYFGTMYNTLHNAPSTLFRKYEAYHDTNWSSRDSTIAMNNYSSPANTSTDPSTVDPTDSICLINFLQTYNTSAVMTYIYSRLDGLLKVSAETKASILGSSTSTEYISNKVFVGGFRCWCGYSNNKDPMYIKLDEYQAI